MRMTDMIPASVRCWAEIELDALSHNAGVARELAVIEKSQVSTPKFQAPKTQGKAAEFSGVEIRDPDLCPRYAARVVRGVKIAPSPDWLAKRL